MDDIAEAATINHPRRAEIDAMYAAGAWRFVRPIGDGRFEVFVGYWRSADVDDPTKTIGLVTVPRSLIVGPDTTHDQ
ncbi:hypothetical protein [Capillimicrobium parvum]|uniref:hypothetical protein n=1 Tax=Capillimicrobium parvum TaxID=2884022 RepID=UPI00216ACF16|nr:hypothetical protein [Capillimicrobium parvum]